MGKAIYKPTGKAGEFSGWACNLHCGCTHKCSYCYNDMGLPAKTLGGSVVRLKKSLVDDDTAFEIFKKELDKQKSDIIRDGGLHFTFVSDPCLKETIDLTWRCIDYAQQQGVFCQVLTKAAWWLDHPAVQTPLCRTNLIRVGFSLTGCDTEEPGASTNEERIALMKKLHEMNVETWVSLEPILDPDASLEMVLKGKDYASMFKIGILSGKKNYSPQQIRDFKDAVDGLGLNVYWKKSLLDFVQKA